MALGHTCRYKIISLCACAGLQGLAGNGGCLAQWAGRTPNQRLDWYGNGQDYRGGFFVFCWRFGWGRAATPHCDHSVDGVRPHA
jgi:hypothetical protein